jgi:hypothetical protein
MEKRRRKHWRALVLAPGTLPLPEVIRADLLEGGIVLMCSAGP